MLVAAPILSTSTATIYVGKYVSNTTAVAPNTYNNVRQQFQWKFVCHINLILKFTHVWLQIYAPGVYLEKNKRRNNISSEWEDILDFMNRAERKPHFKQETTPYTPSSWLWIKYVVESPAPHTSYTPQLQHPVGLKPLDRMLN